MRDFKSHFLKAAMGGFLSLSFFTTAFANPTVQPTENAEKQQTSTTDSSQKSKQELSELERNPQRESIFPSGTRNLEYSHFSWGAEVGTSIDLSGNDMSTINADAYVGYKNKFIRFVGAGVGIHRSFGQGNNFIPIYFLFRSSFRSIPSPLFFHFQAGYSFNTIGDAPVFGDISGSVGMGINLAMSRKFQSHILLAFGFRHFNKRHQENIHIRNENIPLAQIAFGINF